MPSGLRYAIRSLRRQPGFGLTATLTLGVGLGLAIGLFAVVDAVLLRPLPFADQDELVVMWEKDDGSNNPHIEVSLPNFEDWRAEAGSFVDMAAMGSTTWGEVEVQQDPPVRLTISAVSASFFDTLGVQAFVGRPSKSGIRPVDVTDGGVDVVRRRAPGPPVVFGGAAVTITVVGVLAGWVPAYRASRLDPARALTRT